MMMHRRLRIRRIFKIIHITDNYSLLESVNEISDSIDDLLDIN